MKKNEIYRELQAAAAPSDVDINSLLSAMMATMQVAKQMILTEVQEASRAENQKLLADVREASRAENQKLQVAILSKIEKKLEGSCRKYMSRSAKESLVSRVSHLEKAVEMMSP